MHFSTSSSLLSKQDSLIFAVMYTYEVILFPYMAFEVSTVLDQNMTTQHWHLFWLQPTVQFKHSLLHNEHITTKYNIKISIIEFPGFNFTPEWWIFQNDSMKCFWPKFPWWIVASTGACVSGLTKYKWFNTRFMLSFVLMWENKTVFSVLNENITISMKIFAVELRKIDVSRFILPCIRLWHRFKCAWTLVMYLWSGN